MAMMQIRTYLHGDIWELVEVGGVVDRLDMHWDGGGSLPDMVPVHPFEEAEGLDVVKTFDSPLRIRAKSAKENENLFQITLTSIQHTRKTTTR